LEEPDERTGRGEVGWGGWTRTNTVLINSEVSYQLDHAPAATTQELFFQRTATSRNFH
jgi:hypothetical protein